MQLSKEQQAVVDHIHGQVLCVACPGSGKTTVIVDRVQKMLEAGIPGENILVITFTKEAASQMRQRFEDKYQKSDVRFGTIHSMCFQVLRDAYRLTAENVINSPEQWNFFSNLFRNTKQRDDYEEFIKNMIQEISYVRNKVGVNYREHKPDFCKPEEFRKGFEEYKEYKQNHYKIDYDDMLLLTYDLFKRYPNVLEHWKGKFQYIMVDEYQDSNRLQAQIFYMLAGENGNLCVVGDDDQSCYRFRGAESKVFLDFPKKYPNAAKYHLSTNYRSGTEIIKYAGNLIVKNHDRFEKQFLCNRIDSGNVNVVFPKTGEDVKAVVEHIEKLHNDGVDYNDIAVLYRVNAQNELLIGDFLKKEIPFYCTEPARDYHREFIFCDILAYYRLANGMEQSGDLLQILNRPQRYLKRDLFKNCRFKQSELLSVCADFEHAHARRQAMSKVYTLFSDVKTLRDKTPTAFVDYMYNAMGYRYFATDFAKFCGKDVNHIETLMKNLKNESRQFRSMEEWVAYSEYYAEELEKKRKEKKREGVCLSTLHSAKGLEWPHVIIIDAVEGVYPYQKAESPEDYEEERRLFYIGITRAKDNCTIYSSKENPSRYLYESDLLIHKEDKKGEEKHGGSELILRDSR